MAQHGPSAARGLVMQDYMGVRPHDQVRGGNVLRLCVRCVLCVKFIQMLWPDFAACLAG